MADKLTKEALADQRKRLKIRLWRERGAKQVVAGYVRFYPTCPHCDELIMHPVFCAMHEWLIKRSAVPLHLQVEIMHEYNCVLVHYDCHERHGQTREFKLRCARAQYKRYGRDTIVEWVQGLGLKQHVEVPTEEEVL